MFPMFWHERVKDPFYLNCLKNKLKNKKVRKKAGGRLNIRIERIFEHVIIRNVVTYIVVAVALLSLVQALPLNAFGLTIPLSIAVLVFAICLVVENRIRN